MIDCLFYIKRKTWFIVIIFSKLTFISLGFIQFFVYLHLNWPRFKASAFCSLRKYDLLTCILTQIELLEFYIIINFNDLVGNFKIFYKLVIIIIILIQSYHTKKKN